MLSLCKLHVFALLLIIFQYSLSYMISSGHKSLIKWTTRAQVDKFAKQRRSLPIMNSDMMSFGSKMDIKVKLPTREYAVAREFLKNPQLIVETAYDKSRLTRLNDELYLIQFASIPIPGIDVVTPEIEVEFAYRNGTIFMESKKWKLNGGQILKDSRFMQTFDLSLTGRLDLEDKRSADDIVVTVGFVNYQVKGEKPKVLKFAPNFILDGTINFIQNCVKDFVTKQFSSRLLQAFRIFVASQPQVQK